MMQYDPTPGSAVQIGGGGASPITFEATEGNVRARAFIATNQSGYESERLIIQEPAKCHTLVSIRTRITT